MLRFTDALKQLLALAPPPPSAQHLPLHPDSLQDLYGRVLGADLTALRDCPDNARCRMDGYALREADLRAKHPLPVDGTARPGDLPTTLAAGCCRKIFTGAALPLGADVIAPMEQVRPVAAGTDGRDRIELTGGPFAAGDWIRQVAEDFSRGQMLLPAGTVLHTGNLPLVVAAGHRQVSVRRRIRIGFLRLGNELTAAGQPLPAGGQYDLNGPLLAGHLRQLAVEVRDLGIVGDDLPSLCQCLQRAQPDCDLILTCGGASVGDEDFVKPALQQLGHLHFQRVAMRPGMPFIAGTLAGVTNSGTLAGVSNNGTLTGGKNSGTLTGGTNKGTLANASNGDAPGDTLLLGLPGNPMSVFACFHLLAKPLIERMQGANGEHRSPPLSAQLAQPLSNDSERLLLLQAQCRKTEKGAALVHVAAQHSALMLPLAQANCALILEPGEAFAEGDWVHIWPYHSW